MYYPWSENKGAFVFAYADCWFSHAAAQLFLDYLQKLPTTALSLPEMCVQRRDSVLPVGRHARMGSVCAPQLITTRMMPAILVSFEDDRDKIGLFHNFISKSTGQAVHVHTFFMNLKL